MGAVGKTVSYSTPLAPIPTEQGSDLKSLVDDMNAGKVKWLVMLGVNPLYNAPVDYDFIAGFNMVPNTVHLGQHLDETGFNSIWHINQAHYLESWSDARAAMDDLHRAADDRSAVRRQDGARYPAGVA